MVQADVQSTIEALKREYEQVGSEVRETLGRLHSEDLQKKSGDAGRTVGVVAGHLAKSPGTVAGYTTRFRDGKSMNFPRFLIDIANWFEARANRRMAADEFLPKYEEGHARFAAEIDGSGDADWDRKAKVVGQEIDLEGWFRMNIAHERDHLTEIKAGLG